MRALIDLVDSSEVVFRPSDMLASTGWSIHFGPSRFLLCEGPGMSSRLGYAIFSQIADDRRVDPSNIIKADGVYRLPPAKD